MLVISHVSTVFTVIINAASTFLNVAIFSFQNVKLDPSKYVQVLGGDLIGVHYHDNTQANAVVSYATDKVMPLCCNLTREDLPVIHASAKFDDDLKVGTEVSGVLAGERRALAIRAVFSNGMWHWF